MLALDIYSVKKQYFRPGAKKNKNKTQKVVSIVL